MYSQVRCSRSPPPLAYCPPAHCLPAHCLPAHFQIQTLKLFNSAQSFRSCKTYVQEKIYLLFSLFQYRCITQHSLCRNFSLSRNKYGVYLAAMSETVKPTTIYDGGFGRRASRILLRIGNGGAGQSGLIKGFTSVILYWPETDFRCLQRLPTRL